MCIVGSAIAYKVHRYIKETPPGIFQSICEKRGKE